MSEYLDKLMQAARSGSNELFFNGSPDHACDILTAIFQSSENTIGFVTRRLDRDVFGRPTVANSAAQFMAKQGSLRILFDDDPDGCLTSEHPFIAAITDRTKLEIRHLSALALANMPYHFTVGDNRMYRFEPDKTDYKAVACMNDVAHAERLSNIFQSLWNDSSVKRLPDAGK
jgi:hypothetical protein